MSDPRPFIIREIENGTKKTLKEFEIQLGIIKKGSKDGIRIGSTIRSSAELDDLIAYLIANLESIRAEGKILLLSQEISM